MSELPKDLFEGKPLNEVAKILGKWLVMQELDLPFTQNYQTIIARADMFEKNRAGQQIPLNFERSLKKAWTGIYGDTRGFDVAELESAAIRLDVYEDVFNYRDDLKEAA